MKKSIIALILASFLTVDAAPVLALGSKSKSSTPKTVSIAKSHKLRQKSDDFKYEYINYAWWDNFNDPVLTGYIDRAVKNNYSLKMATIAVDEYYQAVRLQFANELPQGGLAFAPAFTKNPGTTASGWTFAMPTLLNYEADIFLKNRDKTRAAKKQYEWSLQDERAAYISVASAVGSAYLNLVKLDKIIDLQEEIVEDRKIIYDLMLARNKEGLTSTADTVKANKSFIAGQTALTELKKSREILLNQFCVLIGETPEKADTITRISYDELNYGGVIPTEISSSIIEQRPDYLKSELQIQKAGIDVRVVKKEFLPTINLTGLAFFLGGQLGSLWTTKNALTALAAGATLPIFTGGARIANLKLKKDEYERLLNNYYQTNLTAIQEVNDALATIKHDNKMLDDTQTQSTLERQNYGYSEAKYNQGTISKLDLIQLKENVLSTDKLLADQRINILVDYIGLYKAVGSKL